MQELGKIHQLIINLGAHQAAFNLEVMLMTWIVMGLLLVFGWLCASRRTMMPGRLQVIGELIVGQLHQLTEDAMGKRLARTYSPLICALFMFLLISNWIGIIPHMEEPSKDLNTPLSLGLMGFAIAHYVGIRTKGFKAYISEYFAPMFFMMPLNLIGELAKIVSISFRLFGNIMGGSIIILVVSYLTYNILLPPFLYAFFGLFVGAIQAFVFTMLTIVYIATQAK
ncbi:MAG: F0F1 ATP synthase subunit A [Desulfatitalea sp.]|nr:F0F1 ATP synthase subunit A [Desulfatitalea sp.]NNJ98819.1 F0F1 ATP synthase subunit A [Desulfatitalea sp.]